MGNLLTQSTFEAAFIDAYGVNHTAAVCAIAAMSRTESCHFPSATDTVGDVTANCYYSVRYWHNVEALTNGAKDLLYTDKDGVGQIQFEIEGNKTMAELLILCQEHFVSTLDRLGE